MMPEPHQQMWLMVLGMIGSWVAADIAGPFHRNIADLAVRAAPDLVAVGTKVEKVEVLVYQY
jgi:hypothetical protein